MPSVARLHKGPSGFPCPDCIASERRHCATCPLFRYDHLVSIHSFRVQIDGQTLHRPCSSIAHKEHISTAGVLPWPRYEPYTLFVPEEFSGTHQSPVELSAPHQLTLKYLLPTPSVRFPSRQVRCPSSATRSMILRAMSSAQRSSRSSSGTDSSHDCLLVRPNLWR